MIRRTPHKRTPDSWLVNAALVCGSIAVTLFGIVILLPEQAERIRLTLFPPDTVVFLEGMGDILEYQYEITRASDDPYRVLAEYPLNWTDDGFRVPARPAYRYDVAVVGDSLTEGGNVAQPFPDVLAAQTGLAVANLGVRGTGPTEQALLMEHVAVNYPVDVVVLQFFGGNDFSNADSYTWRQDFELPEVWRAQTGETPASTRLWRYPHEERTVITEKYPVRAYSGPSTLEINLLEGYLWAYNTTAEDIARSYALAETRRAWQVIDDVTDEACIVVLYIPSKEEIYLPYIYEEDRQVIFETPMRSVVNEDGDIFRTEPDSELTYTALIAKLSIVRDAIATAAAEEGYLFVDATPALQAAAARNEKLYYFYDTHLNQDGHNLVGQVLASSISECGAESNLPDAAQLP